MGSFVLIEERKILCKCEMSLGNINMHERLGCWTLLHYKTLKTLIRFFERNVLSRAQPSFSYQACWKMTFTPQSRGVRVHQVLPPLTSDNTEVTAKEGWWALKMHK